MRSQRSSADPDESSSSGKKDLNHVQGMPSASLAQRVLIRRFVATTTPVAESYELQSQTHRQQRRLTVLRIYLCTIDQLSNTKLVV
jgi:hypothetical protein